MSIIEFFNVTVPNVIGILAST